ncbi:MAG: glycosyltransferase family 2 protein [Candidatus Zixiibacteriota bacterium]
MDPEKKLVSVIIPALNEEGNIEELCRQFDEMVQKSSYHFELVLVDDGSTDRTLEMIEGAARKYDFVKYAVHPFNLGLTDALQTGFAAASGSIYVFYPADLQYKPEDIPALVQPIFERGADVVAGWKQGKYKKRFVSTIYNYLSRKIFGLKVHDLNSVKAFKASVIKDMFMRRDWHRYLVVMAADQGNKIDEVKMPLYERQWGKSKFSSIWRIPIGLLDMMAVKAQLSLLKKPLLFFGMLGLGFFGMGVLAGMIALYFRYFLGEGFRPMLYLVILLIGLGLGFFILGFLGEALAAVREEIGSVRKKLDKLSDRSDS